MMVNLLHWSNFLVFPGTDNCINLICRRDPMKNQRHIHFQLKYVFSTKSFGIGGKHYRPVELVTNSCPS